MLTEAQVREVRPLRYARKIFDSGGMYLLVAPNGGRYWRYNYRFEGKHKTLALGVFPDVPHGYLNDTMPGRYRRPQAELAWQMLISFLDRVHGGGYSAERVEWAFECNSATSYDFTKNVRME